MIIIDQHLLTYAESKSTRLMTTDLKAARHVLFNSYDYPKSEVLRRVARTLFGSGAFAV